MDAMERILLFRENPAPFVSALRAAGYRGPLTVAESREDAVALLAEAEVLIAMRPPADDLSRFTRLRWVQTLSAGVDRWLGAGLGEKVRLTRLVEAFGPAMAEHVLLVLLAAVKGLTGLQAAQAAHRWAPARPALLREKRVGVAGYGAIGRAVGQALHGLGVEVWTLSSRLPGPGPQRRAFTPDRLEAFLSGLDALVSILPKTAATTGMWNRRTLQMLPRGAIFVNVGRGSALVEEDLPPLLASGHIALAALDVFSTEPLPRDNPLWDAPNLLVTPHVSAPTRDREAAREVAENLRRDAEGRPLPGTVDRERGY